MNKTTFALIVFAFALAIFALGAMFGYGLTLQQGR